MLHLRETDTRATGEQQRLAACLQERQIFGERARMTAATIPETLARVARILDERCEADTSRMRADNLVSDTDSERAWRKLYAARDAAFLTRLESELRAPAARSGGICFAIRRSSCT